MSHLEPWYAGEDYRPSMPTAARFCCGCHAEERAEVLRTWLASAGTAPPEAGATLADLLGRAVASGDVRR